MDRKTLKVVTITWVDPTSIDEWLPLVEAIAYLPHVIVTTGYLIAETDTCYITASNVDADGGDVSCCMVIPKVALTKPLEVIA